MKPTGIVIHHSLTRDGVTVDWDAIKRYHMQEKGWVDIGYHAGVERIDGILTTLTGRPIDEIGAHCLGHNDTIGICIVGNYDLAPPDNSMLMYAAAVVAGYLRMFKLPVSSIHRHHDYAEKSCPGTKFPWAQFIGYIEATL